MSRQSRPQGGIGQEFMDAVGREPGRHGKAG